MLAGFAILTGQYFLFQADVSSKQVDIAEVPSMGNSSLDSKANLILIYRLTKLTVYVH